MLLCVLKAALAPSCLQLQHQNQNRHKGFLSLENTEATNLSYTGQFYLP